MSDDIHTTRLSMRLPKDLALLLKNYAFVTGTSGNDVIQRALTDYLQTHRDEMIEAAFGNVLEEHKAALDRLKEM
jgi:hypothetical protein